MTAYIRCNGSTVHINPEGFFGRPQLDAEWGSEQCEGCGEDIVATVKPFELFHGARVRCECGALYNVYIERDNDHDSH